MPGIRELRKHASYWKKALGLDNWEIKLRWGKADEMSEEEAVGLNHIFPEREISEIVLKRGETDLEHTVIHELLHTVLQGHLEPSSKYDPMFERGLNKIAAKLLAFRHQNEGDQNGG